MNARLYQSLFVVFQATIMYWWQVSRVGAVAVWLIVLLAAVARFKIRIGRRVHGIGLVAFGLLFFSTHAADYESTHLAVCPMIAEFLLFIQACELLRVKRTPSSNFLPGLGTLTLASAVLSLKVPIADATLQAVYFGFASLLILVLRPDLPRLVFSSNRGTKKGIILFLAFSVAISLGAVMQETATRQLSELKRSLAVYKIERTDESVSQTAARFVDAAYLNSVADVQLDEPEAPVFTVQSDSCPGYMKTLSFDDFDGWRWRNTNLQKTRIDLERTGVDALPAPQQLRDSRMSANSVFRLSSNASGPYRQHLVHVLSGRGRLVPLPMDAAFILGNSRRLLVRSDGTVAPGSLDVRAYLVYTAGHFIGSTAGAPLPAVRSL
ncbi:MAG: hypothetical protein KDB27_11395, partial [Planctomycetales bacterium]|nr:hypothetical protein [Planctomycetales bacterium]